MSADFQITNCNFICPFMQDGQEFVAHVPQPIEAELKGIARILGSLFTMIREKKLDMIIFLRDWDIYVEDICASLDNGEIKKKALDAYLDRSLLGAKLFTLDGDIVDSFTCEEAKETFKGSLLFFSSLYRYTPKNVLVSELRDCFTFLTATEYQKSLQKPLEVSPQGPGVVTNQN